MSQQGSLWTPSESEKLQFGSLLLIATRETGIKTHLAQVKSWSIIIKIEACSAVKTSQMYVQLYRCFRNHFIEQRSPFYEAVKQVTHKFILLSCTLFTHRHHITQTEDQSVIAVERGACTSRIGKPGKYLLASLPKRNWMNRGPRWTLILANFTMTMFRLPTLHLARDYK